MSNTFHSGDCAALLNRAAQYRAALLFVHCLRGYNHIDEPAWRNMVADAKACISAARYTRLETTAPQGWLIVRA